MKKDVDGIDANIKKDYEAVKDKVVTKTDAAGTDVKNGYEKVKDKSCW